MIPRKTVTFRIANEIHKTVSLYSSYQQAQPKAVHNSFMNFLDGKQYNNEVATLQYFMGKISEMENEPRAILGLRVWVSATSSYMQATPWVPVSGRTDDVAPESTLQRMRRYWQFVASWGGRLPQTIQISPPTVVTDQLTTLDVAGLDPNSLSRDRSRVLAEDHVTGDRPMLESREGEVEFTVRESAQKVGPILDRPLVHDTKDPVHALSGLEDRVVPDCTYKPESDTAKRFGRWWQDNLKYNFTKERIEAAYVNLFGEYKSISEVAMSKFSEADIQRAVDALELVDKPQARQANAKGELIIKSNGDQYKPVRLTYDNGIELMALSYITTKIFQELMYGKGLGLFYKNSIKARPREVVVDDFIKEWMECPNNTFFEVDQTGMERHTRLAKDGTGVLSYGYKALKKIAAAVGHKLINQFGTKYISQMEFDEQSGLTFKMKLPDKKKFIRVKSPDVFLDSGWTLTSGINFANELAATLSSMFMNPERVFARDSKGVLILSKRDIMVKETVWGDIEDVKMTGGFDWKFITVPLHCKPLQIVPKFGKPWHKHTCAWCKRDYDHHHENQKDHGQDRYQCPFADCKMYYAKGKDTKDRRGHLNTENPTQSRPHTDTIELPQKLRSTKSVFKPSVEGDDGAGLVSKVFNTPENTKIVEDNYAEIGFKAKLKFVDSGRVEFIGIHVAVENGVPLNKDAWTPDIKRTLPKLGAMYGNSISAPTKIARFAALASMFCGRVGPMYDMFINAAQDLIKEETKAGRNVLDSIIQVREWDELERVGFEAGKHELRKMVDFALKRDNTCATPEAQRKLISTSIEAPFDESDFSKLILVADNVTVGMDDEEFFTSMPASLRPART
jgi:hypothetical protein